MWWIIGVILFVMFVGVRLWDEYKCANSSYEKPKAPPMPEWYGYTVENETPDNAVEVPTTEEVPHKEVISQYPTFAEAFPEISQPFEYRFKTELEEAELEATMRSSRLRTIPKREDDVYLKRIDSAPRVKKVISVNSYLSDTDKYVEIERDYRYIRINEYEVRPPVLRITEDIDNNFCSWTVVYVDELVEDYSNMQLAKKEHKTICYCGIEKNGIELRWKREFYGYSGGWEYVNVFFKIKEDTLDLTRKELELIESIVNKHRNNIALEAKEDKARQEELKRLALDEVVKGILDGE